MQERHWAMSTVISNYRFGGSRRPQHRSLTAPTRASQSDKILIFFFHVVDWSLLTILRPLPASHNSVRLGSRSVDIHKTYPDHINLFWFSVCSKGWILGPSILRLPSELLAKFLHHILPIPWRQRSFNYRKSSHIFSPKWPRFRDLQKCRPPCRHVYSTSDRWSHVTRTPRVPQIVKY